MFVLVWGEVGGVLARLVSIFFLKSKVASGIITLEMILTVKGLFFHQKLLLWRPRHGWPAWRREGGIGSLHPFYCDFVSELEAAFISFVLLFLFFIFPL